MIGADIQAFADLCLPRATDSARHSRGGSRRSVLTTRVYPACRRAGRDARRSPAFRPPFTSISTTIRSFVSDIEVLRPVRDRIGPHASDLFGVARRRARPPSPSGGCRRGSGEDAEAAQPTSAWSSMDTDRPCQIGRAGRSVASRPGARAGRGADMLVEAMNVGVIRNCASRVFVGARRPIISRAAPQSACRDPCAGANYSSSMRGGSSIFSVISRICFPRGGRERTAMEPQDRRQHERLNSSTLPKLSGTSASSSSWTVRISG